MPYPNTIINLTEISYGFDLQASCESDIVTQKRSSTGIDGKNKGKAKFAAVQMAYVTFQVNLFLPDMKITVPMCHISIDIYRTFPG